MRGTARPLLLLIALVFSAGACGGGEAAVEPPAGLLVVSSNDDLYTVGADGSSRRLVVRARGPQLDADWSPDGRQIVYRDSRSGINRNDEIYVAAADGSDDRNLTDDPGNDWSPAWSPDGDRIAFASDREGELRIFVMAVDGSDVRRVTEIWGEYPAWSPDGRRIAFSSYAGGAGPTGDPNYDLFVVDADGSGLRRLTESPAYECIRPGRRTASRSRSSRPGQHRRGSSLRPTISSGRRTSMSSSMPAEGGEAVNVTRDPVRLQKFPDWSPDGRWIAVDEEGAVAFAAADGSGLRRVSGASLKAAFPAWAPDGG